MKNYLALTLILATSTIGVSSLVAKPVAAAEIHDHRGPVIVVPPYQQIPPVVIIDPSVFQPPVVVQPTEPPHQVSGLSCKQAKRIVKRNGFHHVQTESCAGPDYVFGGDKSGHKEDYYRITVHMDGTISAQFFGAF